VFAPGTVEDREDRRTAFETPHYLLAGIVGLGRTGARKRFAALVSAVIGWGPGGILLSSERSECRTNAGRRLVVSIPPSEIPGERMGA
jgi:hypothetical protein